MPVLRLALPAVEVVLDDLVLRPFVVDAVAESDDLPRARDEVDELVPLSEPAVFLLPEVLPVAVLRLLPVVEPLPVEEEPPLMEPELLPEPIEPVLPDVDEPLRPELPLLPEPLELPELEPPELPEPDIDPDDELVGSSSLSFIGLFC